MHAARLEHTKTKKSSWNSASETGLIEQEYRKHLRIGLVEFGISHWNLQAEQNSKKTAGDARGPVNYIIIIRRTMQEYFIVSHSILFRV